MRFVAVRHAPVRVAGVCYGQLDLPAEPPGPQQMAALLAHLPVVRGIVSSPARRCLDLAERLAAELELRVRPDGRLLELSFGLWEGERWQDLERSAAFQRWMRTWRTTAPPGGETLAELEARVRSLLEEAHEGALLVTHAGVIRTLGVLLEGRSWEEVMRAGVPHLEVRAFSDGVGDSGRARS